MPGSLLNSWKSLAQRLLMEQIKGVLLDITGVLKDGNNVIPGSIEAVKRLYFDIRM
jgi:hypothetical protein